MIDPDLLGQLVDVWPIFQVSRRGKRWHVCGRVPGGRLVSLVALPTEAEARELERKLDAARRAGLASKPPRVSLVSDEALAVQTSGRLK